MKKFLTVIAALCTMLLTVPCVTNAFAAEEEEYELRLQSTESSLYKYSLGRTEYYFFSNIKDGEVALDPVCIYLPDADYTLECNGINGEQIEDGMMKYEISAYGNYKVKIVSPEKFDGGNAVAYMNFIISEYPNGEKVLDFGSGLTIYTNVTGEKIAPGAYFRFDSDVNAVYNYKKESYSYTSEQKLTEEGEYVVHFTSDLDKDFWYDLAFTVSAAQESGGASQVSTEITKASEDNFEAVDERSVSLKGTYDETRGMYKQSLSDECFAFTNVENMGKGEKLIMLYDNNITVVAYKGNERIDFNTNSELTDEGNYTFYISGVAKNDDGVYERLVGTFAATVEKTEEPDENSGEQTAESEEAQKSLSQIMSEINEVIKSETAASEFDEILNVANNTGSDKIIDAVVDRLTDESNLSTGEINQLVAKLVEARVSDEDGESAQEYDIDGKHYIIKFGTSNYITMNVPNGALVNSNVTVGIVGDSLKVKAYKDDEAVEVTNNMSFTEHGDYRIDAEYYDGTQKTITFCIIKHAVNNIKIFNAPTGFMITGVEKDLKTTRAWMTYYKLSTDGNYRFSVQNTINPDLSYEVNIVLDTKVPDFTIENLKDDNSAPKASSLVDLRGDIVRYEVYRNGKLYKLDGGEFTKTGQYNITAYDVAGNQTTKNVKIYYKMQSGSIVSICAVTLIVTVGAAWILYARKNITVS